MQTIVQQYKHKITIMIDSGIRSGVDVARAMASGTDFTFLGTTFMYSVAALGKQSSNYAIGILKTQL